MTGALARFAPLAIRLLLAFDAVIWGYLAYRMLSFPENHWGFDNRLLIPFFAGQLLVALAIARRLSKALAVVFVLIALASVAASVALVSANLLLPYELWLERGMPARPF